MASEDDDDLDNILPEAQVFSNRAEEILKVRDEEYEKLCMKMIEEANAKPDVPDEPVVKDEKEPPKLNRKNVPVVKDQKEPPKLNRKNVPDEKDQKNPPKLTRKKRGGKVKSQEKDISVIESPELEANLPARLRRRSKKAQGRKKPRMQWFSESTPSSPQNSLRITLTRRMREIQPVDDLHIQSVMEKSNSILQSVNVEEVDDITTVEDDYQRDILLKIKYMSEISKIKVKEKEKFATIFERVANLFNLKASEILLCLNDRNIHVDDTPRSLNLGIFDIIDCIPYKLQTGIEAGDLNCICIRIQSSDGQKMDMHVHKLEKMQDFMERCAEKLGIARNNLIFEFDGEKINDSSTPDDLEIEDGSCIDVKIIGVVSKDQSYTKELKPSEKKSVKRTKRTVCTRSSVRSRSVSPVSSNSIPVIDIETEILPSEMLQIVELD